MEAVLQMNILHTLVYLTFGALVILLFVRMILSWLPFLGPGNPVVRGRLRIADPERFWAASRFLVLVEE